MQPWSRRVLVVAVAAPLLLALLLGLMAAANLAPSRALQHQVDDWLLSSFAEDKPDTRVVIVAIDEHSTRGEWGWPWPRQRLAKLVDVVREAGARVVGLDVLLVDNKGVAGDRALAASLARVERSVIVDKIVYPSDGSAPLRIGAVAPFRRTSHAGYYNVAFDGDRVVRRQPLRTQLAGKTLYSFAAQVYRQWLAAGGEGRTQALPQTLRIPYRARTGPFLHVSARALLERKIAPETLRGRIVLIGATFSDSKDRFATPMADATGRREMDGVEIHANVISALLDGRQIVELSTRSRDLMVLGVIVFVGLFGALGLPRLAVGLALALAASALVVSVLAMQAGVAARLAPVALACLFAAALVPLGQRAQSWLARRRRARALALLISKHVGPLAQPGDRAQQSVTICAIGVESFDEIASSFVQRELEQYLVAYLDGVSAIVSRHGGVLSEDTRGGLIAVFGLDPRHDDHTARACRAALDVISAASLLERRARDEVGMAFRTTIGIHAGETELRWHEALDDDRLACLLRGSRLDLPAQLSRVCRQRGAEVCVCAQLGAELPDEFRRKPLGSFKYQGQALDIQSISLEASLATAKTHPSL